MPIPGTFPLYTLLDRKKSTKNLDDCSLGHECDFNETIHH